MSMEENVQTVKNFLAALGRRDRQALLALVAEDIEWIIPGEDWPLAGTHRGHAELADLLQKASDMIEISYPKPPEFVAKGDRVLVNSIAKTKCPVYLVIHQIQFLFSRAAAIIFFQDNITDRFQFFFVECCTSWI